jgi:glycosyltransferase involved in cell wall biosynthesis
VAEGDNGFLFAPGDTDTLAQWIYDIYADPDLAARMGRAGCERAQRYTVDAVSDVLIPILLGEVGK